MSMFEDRRKGFEGQYTHDQELQFRIEVRATKLLGLWAAAKLGLESEAAEAYAKSVVGANMEEPGFDDVKRKILPDFQAQNIAITDKDLDHHIIEFLAKAKTQIMEGDSPHS